LYTTFFRKTRRTLANSPDHTPEASNPTKRKVRNWGTVVRRKDGEMPLPPADIVHLANGNLNPSGTLRD